MKNKIKGGPTMHKAIIELIQYNEFWLLLFVFGFFAIGISTTFAKFVKAFHDWFWPDLDTEERFEYIKVPKWALPDPNRKDFILVEER